MLWLHCKGDASKHRISYKRKLPHFRKLLVLRFPLTILLTLQAQFNPIKVVCQWIKLLLLIPSLKVSSCCFKFNSFNYNKSVLIFSVNMQTNWSSTVLLHRCRVLPICCMWREQRENIWLSSQMVAQAGITTYLLGSTVMPPECYVSVDLVCSA